MNTYTQSLPNFEVRIDGELQLPERPSAYVQARTGLLNLLSGTKEHIKLESALLVYDFIHKTNYRSIRHALMAAKRNEAFEQRIGITAIKR